MGEGEEKWRLEVEKKIRPVLEQANYQQKQLKHEVCWGSPFSSRREEVKSEVRILHLPKL